MALIPPHFANAVVAIGNAGSGTDPTTWIGTAFIWGRPIDASGKPLDDADQRIDGQPHEIYLVTNRHVFEALTNPVVRANPSSAIPAAELSLALTFPDGSSAWAVHPDAEVDIAVTGISLDMIRRDGYEVDFIPHGHSRSVADMTVSGFSEGDSLFLAGFPMGLVGVTRAAAIVRGATLAQFAQLRDGHTKYMLIDGYVFPGNSGGPVFSRPETVAIAGTNAHGAAYLIGVVAAYIPYRDVAISAQTKQPRITFEENSGLSMVFPMDGVIAAANEWRRVHPFVPLQPEAAPEEPTPKPVVLDLPEPSVAGEDDHLPHPD